MRESYIETKVCKHAETRGWIQFKWSSPGNRGVPDRLFLKQGILIFIEFKATGKKATKLQLLVHKRIRQAGFKVYVVDDIFIGKEIINKNS